MEWYLKVVKDNYANFKGRARRKEYWMFVLFNMLFAIGAMVLDNVLGIASPAVGYGPIYGIYALATFVPSLAVGVRRMHDVGKSGWFLLIPFYNLYLAVQDSEVGTNQYGTNPKTGELSIEDNLVE